MAVYANKTGKKIESNRNFWQKNQWLILRRISQVSVITLFLLGPWFGIWWLKGNLNSNLLFGTIPLTDPFIFVQVIASGFWPTANLVIGFAIILSFYLLVGGRVFCSWVCPINIVTDFAKWLRGRLGIKKSSNISRHTRYWLLASVLIASAITGTLVWELVNPVTMTTRGLVFGMGTAIYFIIAVFIFDLFVSKNGWCGHLCPMGATYNLIGKLSLIKINAGNRKDCDDCMDCYFVCPEPQILRPVLKGSAQTSSLIQSSDCTNCARCIDVCEKKVFEFSNRFLKSVEKTNEKVSPISS